MKVTKSVNEHGEIKVNFENIPAIPEKVGFKTGCGYNRDPETLVSSRLTLVSWGDFTHTITKGWDNFYSVEAIAEIILKRHTLICTALAEFKNLHTSSCEVVGKDAFIKTADKENRLYYRGKNGRFEQIK